MMKYAFMSFSCPQRSLDEMLALARRLGYDGVEPRIGSGHKHGVEIQASPAARREIRHKADDSGVALCCIATSCSYADPAKTRENVEQTLRCIDLARDVGAPRIRVFGGNIPSGTSRAQAMDIVVGALESVAQHAAESNVAVCMETHDSWCDPQDVAEVMKRVNKSSVRVNWDIMHPVRVARVSVEEAFRTLKPWIAHVHFHDGVTRGEQLLLQPIGTGEVDHRTAVRLLKSASYTGYLSGEWINWEPYELHLPRELATMKRYETEP